MVESEKFMNSSLGLLDGFRLMARMRQFELACLAGVETREIHGELHLGIGQEAIAAGMAGSLRAHDAMATTHRCHLHAIAKGVPLLEMLAEIFEREGGLCKGRGGHMHLFDPVRRFSTTGIVGSSLGVALGHAYSFMLEDNDGVAVGITGDGGTNIGAFHEVLNMAGAWELPLVVVVENNRYAISVALEGVLATPTIAERASAYRAWGRLVDGTDFEVVQSAFAEAVEYARERHGPAILEATCHRFRGHYEGDIDHYRSAVQKKEMQVNDPLNLARSELLRRGEATAEELDCIEDEATAEMQALLAEVRSMAWPDASEALRFRFVEEVTS